MRFIALANRVLLATALVTVAAGCAGPRPAEAATSSPSTATPPATSTGASAGCPMMVPGVQSSVADTDAGVAITFVAPADHVDALRDAVHRMAQQRDAMASCPCRGRMGDAGAMRGMRGMTMMQQMKIPPASAQAEDVPGGARLTLTAKNASDVDALRSRVRMHVEHMKSGGCPMM